MPADLRRLLSPRSVAVIGGGAWGRSVVERCRAIGFGGPIWPVHPTRAELGGLPCLPSLAALPEPPDAAFVAVNRAASIEVVAELAGMGAGGAVCFAAGFAEAAGELADGPELQRRLIGVAGAMPILGPNCYGFINYLDGVCLWPDQHGGAPVERGIALVGQSSNMLINLTMQQRGVPIAYAVAAGNQAQIGLAEIAAACLADPRVTAVGLHVEGVGDPRAMEALAAAARVARKPIVALRVGRSEAARAAALSHTASLAGSSVAGDAFFARLGIPLVRSLPDFLAALSLLHVHGGLPGNRLAALSCSGGEASLIADAALAHPLRWVAFDAATSARLAAALGPRVHIANPLDYNTYIWGDVATMGETVAAVASAGADLTLLVLDIPRADRCDPSAWDCAIEAAHLGATGAGPLAVVATLPECLPEPVADGFREAGIAPLLGNDASLAAAASAAEVGRAWARPPAAPCLAAGPEAPAPLLDEAEAKSRLAAAGVPVAAGRRAATPADAATAAAVVGFPVALKGLGHAHKTEAGAVRLGLATGGAVLAAACEMPAPEGFLVERMVTGGVAELLIGITREPPYGFALTIGAGGTLAELLADSATLLLPAGPEAVRAALSGLRVMRLLEGHRGKPAGDVEAVIATVAALERFAEAEADRLAELEINPLIVTPDGAWAADALLRLATRQGDHA